MVAQGPVTVATEVDHVIDVSRGQGFFLMMVRLTVHENPAEMRGCDDRSWGDRHWQWNQQPPHISFLGQETENKSTWSSHSPSLKNPSTHPCSAQHTPHQWQSTRDQSNQLLPSSPWAALDTLDSNIPCFLSLKESWALRIFCSLKKNLQFFLPASPLLGPP